MSNIFTDAINLDWSKCDGDVDFYEICYRKKTDKTNWKTAKTVGDQSKITITGLMADTTYVFQVRGVFKDYKGEYSTESSDVQTFKSLTTRLALLSMEVTPGNPSIRQLLAKELLNSRNDKAKTKKVILGKLLLNLF